MMMRTVFEFAQALNPRGKGRILHHLRLGRYERAYEIARQALLHSFHVWRNTRTGEAFRNYRDVVRLAWMLRSLERQSRRTA